MNPTSFGSHSKPQFFQLLKDLHVIFSKHIEILLEKTQDSLENSKSKGSFSQKTLKSFLFDWEIF